MKKEILFYVILIVSIILNISFYSKNSHQKTELLNEINKNKILLEKLNTSTYKANLSKFKNLLANPNPNESKIIIEEIRKLDIYNNKSKLFQIYENKSGIIIDALESLYQCNQTYIDSLQFFDDVATKAEDNLKISKKMVLNLRENGYKEISFIVSRRFDTDIYSGKGYYEAIDVNSYRKVVLIANENEVKSNYYGEQITLFVKSLGEKSTTITNSNSFRSWKTTEYYEYFETSELSIKSFKEMKKQIIDIEKELKTIKSNLKRYKKNLFKVLETESAPTIKRLINLLWVYNVRNFKLIKIT